MSKNLATNNIFYFAIDCVHLRKYAIDTRIDLEFYLSKVCYQIIHSLMEDIFLSKKTAEIQKCCLVVRLMLLSESVYQFCSREMASKDNKHY